MGSQGGTGSLGGTGGMDQLDLLEKMDKMETLDPEGGPPTPGGGRVLAHKLEALSYSTLASLEEASGTNKEVQSITCVCREAQSSHQNTAPTSHTEMGGRDIHMCMQQSMRLLCKAHDHDAPCAVCYVSTRPTVVMIPARASCPPTWTREYYGYLMSERYSNYRSTFECVDEDQESLPDSASNYGRSLFYHVEASCDTDQLPCPPYDQNNELNCVVCTK